MQMIKLGQSPLHPNTNIVWLVLAELVIKTTKKKEKWTNERLIWKSIPILKKLLEHQATMTCIEM